MERVKQHADRHFWIYMVGGIFVVGIVFFLLSGEGTTGKAIEFEGLVTAGRFDQAFSESTIGDLLPSETNIQMRVYMLDETDYKDFYVTQSGIADYAGQEVDLVVEIWQSTYEELLDSNDFCLLKEKTYKYETKETFNLLKYLKVNRACS
tara:strand:+ start:809 stop:1258 length:450 start_codon:yes stop_codon:yes gene_type:complete